ncbi:thiol:disulfide interchange protein DsbA/DsbL [Flavobacterium sp. MXW15]|uniref:Thiol:disulfide interchange protein n=1 Tax=Xanthomonas chitinilytica TaxID=2989819 RepID=A0ABT3JT37_9XANT|nr:thiol:disulfide interchange protein DsbA/DsbL [Xanthomonas sp. H13-6]MCW4455599.1 thiol:disulfide interchange protein DsbA/DsbL [Flavobacterium sp. MXW15]MCW4471595.1 thiol:disulfide interchange protein DsbA/DsbL [Xanthomonas sp. H13-6]
MKLVHRLMFLLLALLPLTACAAANPSAPPVAGKDYEEIADPQPFAPLDGKIEVVEVFGYTCGHCAHFEPILQPWVTKLPRDVRFTLVPGAFGGHWDAFARAYYAAEQLGVAQRSHAAMFDALHARGSLPMQNVSPQELATFYADYGVAPERFVQALRGEQVDQRLKAAREFALRSGVRGTPTLVVNGKYLVTGRSFEDTLRIADALVARERAAAKRR